MSQNVFVSPGVYTSEKDISFITRQVGVTTLGLVGETTIGPAFQPIFITNYGEFQSFFGGQNATKVKDTGAPQYELPYIAKSYLSQANQLFVTRVLGFSGYFGGLAWGIALDAAMDPATSVATSVATTATTLFNFTATTGTTSVVTALSSADSILQNLWDDGLLTTALSTLGTQNTGFTDSVPTLMYKTGNVFTGESFTYRLINKGISGTSITGITSGVTITYSGTPYAEVDNQIVGLLRSRGSINSANQLPAFEVTGTTQVIFNPAYTNSTENPKGDFSLSGVSNLQGVFNYTVSLDSTKMNYLPRVLGRGAQDGKTALFLEEFFPNMLGDAISMSKVRGLKQSLVQYSDKFQEYRKEYQPAQTPYIVSELRGNKVLRLFRFITISDGNAANEQFKMSIVNIKPDSKEFDILIRGFYDTDAQPVVLESFSRCTMDPTSANFIGRRIGTLDGLYTSKSNYVLVELDEESDTTEAFPAGFVGYPIRDYQSNGQSTVVDPIQTYKTVYGAFENKRKYYLGLSETQGIDSDFFDYKGQPYNLSYDAWTGLTSGFHMDVDASGVTIDNVQIVINSTGGTYSPIFTFQTGNAEFRTEADLIGTDYEKIFSRKFTFAPYGGFDGWDIYRTRRSNLDTFIVNGKAGIAGRGDNVTGAFKYKTLSNGDIGINSDYYAYLEAIKTFENPEAVNINVFATPGIDNWDNTNLIEAAIEMVEQDRADSLYIMTTPDYGNGAELSPQEAVDILDNAGLDSNYSCTYWPWVQINDTENNVLLYVPPTRDVVRNIALTDNIAFPWFATAGIQRGDVDAIKARRKLTLAERDLLYENRINPIATFTSDGIKIWGNKTLQVKESALNRINVRRLLLQARKLISAVSIRLLFEQNDSVVRNQFLGLVNPILDNIRSERGLTDFRVVLSNSPEDIDRNQLTGQIFLKPTRALEFIQLEFVIMNTGASFSNI
jgi:phage tail sheath protein FI